MAVKSRTSNQKKVLCRITTGVRHFDRLILVRGHHRVHVHALRTVEGHSVALALVVLIFPAIPRFRVALFPRNEVAGRVAALFRALVLVDAVILREHDLLV